MKSQILPLIAALMISWPAAAKDNDDGQVAQNVSKKPQTVTDRRDPNYVRCRSEPIIGTKSRTRRVCMTNAEWKTHIQNGSDRANEFMDDIRSGANSPN